MYRCAIRGSSDASHVGSGKNEHIVGVGKDNEPLANTSPPEAGSHGRDVTRRELVDFLDMDRMHISQIASRLEHDGLIRRRETAKDLRAKLITLTAAGQAILERAVPVVEAFDRAFFACPVPSVSGRVDSGPPPIALRKKR
jgi:hypothetical protein